jgi:hypothetical protein
MGIKLGSARHDENGKYTGGKKGDQLQKSSTNDLAGECSIQNFYLHSKGWNVLRPINVKLADLLSIAMFDACNNKNIGYSQSCQRKTIDNLHSLVPINVDCSKLVRDCIYEASHVDVGNFTTANEVAVLEKSGLFQKHFSFKSLTQTPLYNGDVLVTKTKGHTVIVVSGISQTTSKYYSKYTGSSISLVNALYEVGEKDTSLANRSKIAKANGINFYVGSAKQNTDMLNLLKQGKLIKP